MTTPDDAGQGLAGDEAGATGGSDPGAADAALKAENAGLRQANREERAKRLGAEHQLTPTQVELLQSVAFDEQEKYATRLAEESKAQANNVGSAAPPAQDGQGENAPPPPEAADALAGMESGGEAPQGGDQPASDWQTQMNQELAAAATKGDFDLVQEIQAKYQAISRAESIT